jgi:hypothetical protein
MTLLAKAKTKAESNKTFIAQASLIILAYDRQNIFILQRAIGFTCLKAETSSTSLVPKLIAKFLNQRRHRTVYLSI